MKYFVAHKKDIFKDIIPDSVGPEVSLSNNQPGVELEKLKSYFSQKEPRARSWGEWKLLEPFPESLNDSFFKTIFTSPTLKWVSRALHPAILKVDPTLHIFFNVFLLVLITEIAQVFFFIQNISTI